MLSNFQFVILVCILSLVPFWLISKKLTHIRSGIIVAASLIVVAVISFESFVLAGGIMVQALVMLKLQRVFKFSRTIWFSALIFIPLFLSSSLKAKGLNLFETVGLSYYTLKLYSLLRDVNRLDEKPSLHEVVLYIFFFPVFSVGPIENFKSLNPAVLNVDFSLEQFVYGCVRVAFGLFKVLYLANTLLLPLMNEYSLTAISSLDAWLWTILSFAFLYLNFSGFSDIAIGVSRLFGICIRENFNHPYLAKNIQEFWQRWHISLGAWVSQYLYFPLVRNNGKPLASLFLVFVLMGAWHHFSYNYLIWGAMHGAAMVVTKYFDRWASGVSILSSIRTFKVYSICTGIMTLSYVAILSKFANFKSFAEGVTYIKVIF